MKMVSLLGVVMLLAVLWLSHSQLSLLLLYSSSSVANDNYEDFLRPIILSKTDSISLSSNASIDPFILGKRYSAKACFLDPPWGVPANSSSGTPCVGKNPALPFTTAKHLACQDKPSDISKLRPGLTIALLHFANPSTFIRQLENFASYPVEIQKQLTILIIDDGSPEGLRAKEYVSDHQLNSHFRIRMARIVTAKAWNIGGARNLAFHLVDTLKVFLLDLDTLVPLETMKVALTLETRNSSHFMAHKFNRRRPDGTTGKHPAVTVIDAEAYWFCGGCDEDFCGRYGFTDVHFWKRWKADRRRLLKTHMKLFIEEVDQSSCDEKYIKNKEALKMCTNARTAIKIPDKSKDRNKKMLYRKSNDGCWSNKYLRFAWKVDL